MFRKKILTGIAVSCFALSFAINAHTVEAATTSTASTATTSTTTVTKETTESTEEIIETVPQEPASSDLSLKHSNLRLDANRWIQSFAKDGDYYYFVQMTNPNKDLRITRIKYTNPGRYTKDHMDLKGFGHGTNMDVSVYKGKTYIWIGSNGNSEGKATTISCFRYKKNAIYYKKAGNTCKIRMKGSVRNAKNVCPAVSADNRYVFVRYTSGGKQYFQKYKIYSGNKIKGYKPLTKTKVSATAGDFQGFDVSGNYIYTIEGSPNALFLMGYDKSRKFEPTVIRRINYKSGSKRSTLVSGAKNLSFREPEGIKVFRNGSKEIMYVSHTLSLQLCNIYRWKK